MCKIFGICYFTLPYKIPAFVACFVVCLLHINEIPLVASRSSPAKITGYPRVRTFSLIIEIIPRPVEFVAFKQLIPLPVSELLGFGVACIGGKVNTSRSTKT